MAKFKFAVTVDTSTDVVTARVGSAANLAGRLVDDDKGKFVKLAGDSQYGLCAAGDAIEGAFIALEPATQDGWAIGSVQKDGRMNAICDGLQATAGTGTIAIGDYVVAGTAVAAGTALTTAPKVCKATAQTATPMMWRVVSLGVAGAVGDTCVIERV
jgi:hypothetical protein